MGLEMENLNELAVFVRVVQAESFSAAARALGLTPSAVSKQISRLENRLGARLLNRTTRRLGMTEVGSAFFERAQRILSDLHEAEQAVTDMQGTARGLLRIDVPVGFGRMHIAPALPDFFARCPEVSLDMRMNDRFVDLLEEGVDMAVRIGDLQDSSLIAKRLAQNRRLVVGSPEYLERHGAPREPADLTQHNCVVYTYRQSRHDWRFTGPDGTEQQVRVSGNLETNNGEALHAAVLQGLGIALLPLWMVGRDLGAGRLVEVLSDFHAPDSAIYAIYPHARHLSPKVRCFVDFLAERFGGDGRAWT